MQKERETATVEVESLTEKVDLLQAQLGKAQRDREASQTEIELVKEKYEKSTQQSQRLMVRMNPHFGFSIRNITPAVGYCIWCKFISLGMKS